MSTTPLLRTPLLNGSHVKEMRQQIAAYFNAVSDRYESLFTLLKHDDAFYHKPNPLRHPLIFYYGHTATFFINKLLLAGLIEQRLNPEFESMFAVGVDEMSWDDLDDNHYHWPSVAAVRAYRQQVRKLVNHVIAQAPLTVPVDWDNPWWAIMMGIEHEQIHLETSSVLIREHHIDRVQARHEWSPCQDRGAAPENSLKTIPAGNIAIGKDRDDPVYGWDNEYGTHQAEIAEFQASQYLVSNQEFLDFVEAQGYQNAQYWEPEGWQWRTFSKAGHPVFWLRKDDEWYCRLLTDIVPMPWNWPVEVNYHEAKAFCNWKAEQTGKSVRLPTEDEWYRMLVFAEVAELEDGKQAPANIHLDYQASSCPVNRFRHGDLFDVIGNVWQWTETPIYPFEGFKVHPLYDDFTMPTFDGKHQLFKGGSWISCGNESRQSARYAFRRHFFQHAGFRYVVAGAVADRPPSHYENDKMLSEYAEFHYGEPYFGVDNFPQTLVRIALDALGDRPKNKALDIGCAVGRATFELAREFEQVTGIDFSARLINLGVQLAEQGVIRYSIVDEGDLKLYRERRLSELGLQHVRHKVTFLQGDACNLKPHFKGYDLILAANLIDRLYEPARFLSTLHARLNPGGVLLIASPYTWLEAHTKKQHWLGGFKKDGESVTTLAGLKAILAPHFELMASPQQVPFVIRETRRKFQHTLSEVTLWVKRKR